MAQATKSRNRKAVVSTLLERDGRTYAAEAGFTVRDTPAPLFRLLCLSMLLAHRIRAEAAVSAARALADAGWTTVDKLRASTWEERVKVLNRSGYARYDESTSRMLGQSADLLADRYGGDLRRLREAAGRDPGAERRLLREFTGIGDVGVDIFFREAQGAWGELFPFVDDRTAAAAERLGLPSDARKLASLAGGDFVELVAALIRVALDDRYDEVLDRS